MSGVSITDDIKNFNLLFSELSGAVSDELLEIYLEMARSFTNKTVWGNKYVFGVLYLTAHYVVLKKNDESTGGTGQPKQIMNSVSVDGLSMSMGNNFTSGSSDETLSLTSYGQRYIEYRNLLKSYVLVVPHRGRW